MSIRGVPTADVAIVGMSVLLPGAKNLHDYWSNLIGGVDTISAVPAHRWDPAYYSPDAYRNPNSNQIYCRRGGFVDELAQVDVTRFGISPAAVAGIEPDQLLALSVAAAAIDDAGGSPRLGDGERVGVILGRGGYVAPSAVRFLDRVRGARQLTLAVEQLFPDVDPATLDLLLENYGASSGDNGGDSATGPLSNLAASRIANRLGLGGPAYTIDAACASSLVAVDHAVAELSRERCDVVLAGGVHHVHEAAFWVGFSQLRALSPSQMIRPFDRRADGTLIGEGTGVVVLKRLADAERAGDRIYAVIRGVGVSSDGRGSGLLAPNPHGQARAIEQAWREAGLDPTQPGALGMLEAHGTGTPVGDAAELQTLAKVFGPPLNEAAPVLGSVKSMIGHIMTAAGVAGLVKTALAVYHGTVPPTLHCEEPAEALRATRFRTVSTAQPWPQQGQRAVRRAAVNAFGFGGVNTHVVLEEAPGARILASVGWSHQPERTSARSTAVSTVREPNRILCLAGPTRHALLDLLEHGRPDAVESSQDGSVRLGITNPVPDQINLARRIVQRGNAWRGQREIWFTENPLFDTASGGRVAFVFAGLEGDVPPNVGELADALAVPAPVAADAGLLQHGHAIVQLGQLLDQALRRCGLTPDDLAGHSIGEWTAMLSAGVLPADCGERLIDFIGLDSMPLVDAQFALVMAPAEKVEPELGRWPGVYMSHENSPHQTIICGPDELMASAVAWYRTQGLSTAQLPFRSGFHTPYISPYLPLFNAYLGRFGVATARLWSATLAAPAPHTEQEQRDLFLRHLVEPVRWRHTVRAMYDAGVRAFVQLGIGQLGSLIQDELDGSPCLVVAAASKHRDPLHQLGNVLTALWVEGRQIAPQAVRSTPVSGLRTIGPSTVRLDLGTPLTRLDEPVRQAVSSALRRQDGIGAAPAGPARATNGCSQVEVSPDDVSELGNPAIADALAALVRETTDAAAAVVNALRSHGPTTDHAHVPTTTALTVSTAAMPYLRDHTFFRQRAGWPDESDLWPVVPATTIVELMIGFATRAAGGRTVIALHDLRLHRWLVASPPVDVPITVTPAENDRWAVRLGDYSNAVLQTAPSYPDSRPERWSLDPAGERSPEHTARELYTTRILFHGPGFQGISDVTALGPRHIRGTIITPPAPGALLDNAGQLLGYWINRSLDTKSRVLPARLRRITFFGPHPAPASPVECLVQVRHIADTTVEADMQLLVEGQLWAQVDGWVNRRFDHSPTDHKTYASVELHPASQVQPAGWVMLCDRWSDAASRELVMRNYLGQAERDLFERCPAPLRRQWLLGRIAIKDAIRGHLWAEGEREVFPAEIAVADQENGPPRVCGVHGRVLPDLDLSVAHCPGVVVALARPRLAETQGYGVGISIEEVPTRFDSSPLLTDDERREIARLATATGDPEYQWLARLRTARAAVAAAEGAPLDGAAGRFLGVSTLAGSAAHQADGALDIEATGDRTGRWSALRRYRVHYRQATGFQDPAQRQHPAAKRYLVSWTAGPAER